MAAAKVGTTDVQVCYIGTNVIQKAFLGTIPVCDSADQIGLLIRYTFSDVKVGRKT